MAERLQRHQGGGYPTAGGVEHDLEQNRIQLLDAVSQIFDTTNVNAKVAAIARDLSPRVDLSRSHAMACDLENLFGDVDSLPIDTRGAIRIMVDRVQEALQTAEIARQKELNLQANLAASENLNKRLIEIVGSAGRNTTALISKAMSREKALVADMLNVVRQHDRVVAERDSLDDDLQDSKQQIAALVEENRARRKEIENARATINSTEQQLRQAKIEASQRQLELRNIQEREAKLHSDLQKERSAMANARAMEADLRQKFEQVEEAHMRELHALDSKYKKHIDTQKKVLKDTLESAAEETRKFAEERDKYYSLYTSLIAEFNEKKAMTSAHALGIVQRHLKSAAADLMRVNVETKQTAKALQEVSKPKKPRLAEAYLREVQTSTEEIDSPVKENARPVSQPQRNHPRSRSIAGNAARHYDVTGRFRK